MREVWPLYIFKFDRSFLQYVHERKWYVTSFNVSNQFEQKRGPK